VFVHAIDRYKKTASTTTESVYSVADEAPHTARHAESLPVEGKQPMRSWAGSIGKDTNSALRFDLVALMPSIWRHTEP